MNNGVDPITTAQTKARYNRIARFYNLMEWMPEHQFKPWRQKLWSYARADVLEVGIGTGKNFDYYPPNVKVTGIELADQMLTRAREYAQQLGTPVELGEGDVQALEFPDNSFDTAAATFVFCSVPDPVRGLHELNRVVKPGGQVLLLEHVRLDHPLTGGVMDWLNPFIVRLWGANINRRTIENVQGAELEITSIEHAAEAG